MERIAAKYEVFRQVGIHIRRFTHSKFRTNKALAEKLGISHSALTKEVLDFLR